MNTKTSFLVLFAALVSTALAGYKWPKEKIPNPFSDDPPQFCNLAEQGHALCDVGRQLDKLQIQYILDRQKELAALGKCPCSSCEPGKNGLITGLLIIDEYEELDYKRQNLNEANSVTLSDMSDYVRKVWNKGSVCDNSVLITIATKQKKYGISIGENVVHVLNDTGYWLNGILEENFRNRDAFVLFTKVKDILGMYKEAIKEEMRKKNEKSDDAVALTDSNNNNVICTIITVCIVITVIAIISIILFVLLRHRKENDDVSLRDVWTKKFWLKAGNQYKEAKQSESGNEKDIEKNEDEEVKAKLASTEDLKPVDIDLEFPGKLSKV